MPDELSVFSVCALFRSIQADQALKLNEADRQQLSESVSELEQAHFAPDGTALNKDVLRQRAETWLSKVNAL